MAAVCVLRTCRYLLEVTVGTHCMSLVLQQPEHLCTSTHGGHSMKLALRRSSMDLVTSITSVRTLQAACCAGCASTVGGRERKESEIELLAQQSDERQMEENGQETQIDRKGCK